MGQGEAAEDEIAEQPLAEIVTDDEAMLEALTVAGEEIIRAIARHVEKTRPLAERLARWVVEMVK